MSSSSSYPAPVIPETPSQTINLKLQSTFSSPPTSVFQAVFGKAVCGFFSAIVYVYTTLTKDHPERNTMQMWMASCAVIAIAACLGSWISYTLIIALAFVFHAVLYYGAVLHAMVAVGLAVAGAVAYKQDNAGGASTTRSAPHRPGAKFD
jgi:hypothetical protein